MRQKKIIETLQKLRWEKAKHTKAKPRTKKKLRIRHTTSPAASGKERGREKKERKKETDRDGKKSEGVCLYKTQQRLAISRVVDAPKKDRTIASLIPDGAGIWMWTYGVCWLLCDGPETRRIDSYSKTTQTRNPPPLLPGDNSPQPPKPDKGNMSLISWPPQPQRKPRRRAGILESLTAR